MFSKKEKTFNITATNSGFENHRHLQEEDRMHCPDWAKPVYDVYGNYEEEADALYPLFDPLLQQRFYREGTIALGALVQANTLLFNRGKDNCPANFIYTTDPFYTNNPEELESLAHNLFLLKGTDNLRPSLQRLADLMEDEVERIFAYKLPRDFTNHREVFFTTVFVDRSHLPEKRITCHLLPLIILKNNQPDAMILPHWYWKDKQFPVEEHAMIQKTESYALEIEDHLYEIYQDFQRRNNIEEWTYFLCRPELSDKSIYDSISAQLLSYHLDCGNIKQEIVKYLEEYFHYTDRIDEYAEEFTYTAMEYYTQILLAKEEFPPISDFEDLSLDADYDGFIEKFKDIFFSDDLNTPESYLKELNILKEFHLYHPYMALLESEYFARCQNAEKALDVLHAMKPCYHRSLALGLLLMELEYYEEAEESLRYAFELYSQNAPKGSVDNAFVEGMFISLFCQGKHKEALDFSDEMEAFGFADVLAEYKREVLSSFYECAGEKAKHTPLNDDEISLIFEYLKQEKEYEKIIALGVRQQSTGTLSQRDWLTLIEACMVTGDTLSAERNLQLAFQCDEHFSEKTWIQLNVLKAQLYLLKHQTAEAYGIMDEFYQKDSLDVKQLKIYAQMCSTTGRYQTAEKIYSKLRFIMPREPVYTIALAKLFLQMDENERAYHFSKKGLKQFPEQEDLAFVLVQSAIDDGKSIKAKHNLEKMAKILSEGKFRFLKGQIAEMNDNCRQAKNIYGAMIVKEGFDQFEPELAEDIYFRYFLMLIEEEIPVDKLFDKMKPALSTLSSTSKIYQLYGEVLETTMEDAIEAKKYYLKALEANPYNNSALLKLIDLCIYTYRYEEAWQYATQYVLNTDSADAFMLRAHIALDADRFSDFSADVAQYIEHGGTENEAWSIAADHAMKTGHYEKALAYYEKLLKQGPSDELPCYQEMATCYCKMGRYQDAIELLQQAVVQEDYASLYPLLMEIQLYIGDFSNAKKTLEDFRKVRGLSKSSDDYVFYRALQLLAAGKYKTVLLTCASMKDDEVNLLNSQAWLLNGNYKMAVGAFTLLREEDEYNIDLMCWLSLAFKLNGDDDEARRIAVRGRSRFKSVHGEPEEVDRPDLLCQYGLLQTICGKTDRAEFAFQKALSLPTCQEEICRTCHEAHYGLGLMHAFNHNEDASREAFDLAIELSPYNSVYKTLKAKLTK